MKKFNQSILSIMSILVLFTLSGCATTGSVSNNDTKIEDAIATAKRVNIGAQTVLDTVGPIVVSGICITQPQDCAAAKTALLLAKGTNTEISNLIAAAEVAHQAPDGAKLAALAATFVANMDDLNKLIVAYDGKPLDMGAFRDTVAEIQSSAK